MNEERLKELTGRAERAKQLAADIERLNKADPFAYGVEIRFRPEGKNSGAEYIEFSMLQEVLDRGRKSLIADKEAELETIPGWAEIPAATVPSVFIPQFSVASDPPVELPSITPHTATPIPQPFAEITC